jgi:hypothetical protein
MLQLTASASNLSRIEEKVDEYASLLMEVLDPENLGYIEVSLFFFSSFHSCFSHYHVKGYSSPNGMYYICPFQLLDFLQVELN